MCVTKRHLRKYLSLKFRLFVSNIWRFLLDYGCQTFMKSNRLESSLSSGRPHSLNYTVVYRSILFVVKKKEAIQNWGYHFWNNTLKLKCHNISHDIIGDLAWCETGTRFANVFFHCNSNWQFRFTLTSIITHWLRQILYMGRQLCCPAMYKKCCDSGGK